MKPEISILTVTNVFLSLVIFLIVLSELYGVNKDLNMVGEEFKEEDEKGSQKAPTLDNGSQMGAEGGEKEGGGGGVSTNEPKKASGPTEEVKVIDPLKYEFSGYQNGYFRLGTFLFQWGMGAVFFSRNFDEIFGGMATMNTNMTKTKKNPKMEFVQSTSARIFNEDKPCYWCVWGYKASEDQGFL